MNSSAPYDQELRRCLEEAGLYEENMDQEDMLRYYDAIKSSENSAKEEIEHRNLLRESEENVREIQALRATNKDLEVSLVTTDCDGITDESVSGSEKSTRKPVSNEKPFTSKILSKKKTTELVNLDSLDIFTDEISVQPVKETDPDINLKQSIQDDSSEESVGLDDIDVYNCALSKHKPLEVIMHDPKLKLPLYYEQKFLDMDLKARKNVLFDFHNTLLTNFYKLHCKSINPVQYGKPISANGRFNGSLDRKISNFGEDGLAENSDDNSEFSENTEIYTSRSGRQTKRKVYSDSFFDNESKKSKKTEDTPFKIATKSPAKRQCLSKLSNQDIMKRSKLFTDSAKGSRAEKMFDSLKENDAKKKQADKEMDAFKETLKDMSDDEDFIENSQGSPSPEVEMKEIKPKEMPTIRRRIPPPLRGRRGINNRINSARGKATKPLETQINRQQSQEISSTEDLTVVTPEPKQKSTKQMAKCPICSDSFVQEEIEEHASSCGLAMETESNFETVNSRSKKIKCNICDMEMLLNTDYELHVKECLANIKSSSI